jgi:hypothetical protein
MGAVGKRTIHRLVLAGALACLAADCSLSGHNLRQGWTEQQRIAWYEASQGSRLIPFKWFEVLERPGSDQPFMDQAYLTEFRFLPSRADRPDPLPVGFAIDDSDDRAFTVTRLNWYEGQTPRERWVGLNCAACHTAEIRYHDTELRIDGGPSLVDFQSFIEALDTALVETRDVPAKWERFAAKVLDGRDTPANRAKLKAALASLIAWEARVESLNRTPLRYGFARVDAFGHIFNKIALFDGAANPTPNAADAPVSFPQLWYIFRQKQLQWNGAAATARLTLAGRTLDYGALGRNIGEVLGVFGEVIVGPHPSPVGYHSSARVANLIRMEYELTSLQAPVWPEDVFGAIDRTKAEAGRALFNAHCAECHTPRNGRYETMVPFSEMQPIDRTDPWMACNAFGYTTASGHLAAARTNFLIGDPIEATAPSATLLGTTVKGAMIAQTGRILASTAQTFAGIVRLPRMAAMRHARAPTMAMAAVEEDERSIRLNDCLSNGGKLMAYKARPLEGIWATAPYLHNGSVPTLYDLLRPAALRPTTFRVGTREFDPAKVGYLTSVAPGNDFEFRTLDDQGKPIPGNSNAGHEYGVGDLTENQRLEILEYLKSL